MVNENNPVRPEDKSISSVEVGKGDHSFEPKPIEKRKERVFSPKEPEKEGPVVYKADRKEEEMEWLSKRAEARPREPQRPRISQPPAERRQAEEPKPETKKETEIMRDLVEILRESNAPVKAIEQVIERLGAKGHDVSGAQEYLERVRKEPKPKKEKPEAKKKTESPKKIIEKSLKGLQEAGERIRNLEQAARIRTALEQDPSLAEKNQRALRKAAAKIRLKIHGEELDRYKKAQERFQGLKVAYVKAKEALLREQAKRAMEKFPKSKRERIKHLDRVNRGFIANEKAIQQGEKPRPLREFLLLE